MVRPVVANDTEILYEAMGRQADGDEALGWPLLIFLDASGRAIEVVDDLARDDALGRAGWWKILDVDQTVSEGLGYLAQFVGVKLLVGLSDADQRARIKSVSGRFRGTPDALIAAARQYLTGTKRVDLYEREGGAYFLRLRTFAAETPDPAAVAAAILAEKPAGLILTYELAPGMTYTELDAAYTTYDNMKASLLTYDQLHAGVP